MHKVLLNVMEILDQRRPPLGAFSGSASKISHRLESADDLWEQRAVRGAPCAERALVDVASLGCGERQHDSCEEPGVGACFFSSGSLWAGEYKGGTCADW